MVSGHAGTRAGKEWQTFLSMAPSFSALLSEKQDLMCSGACWSATLSLGVAGRPRKGDCCTSPNPSRACCWRWMSLARSWMAVMFMGRLLEGKAGGRWAAASRAKEPVEPADRSNVYSYMC